MKIKRCFKIQLILGKEHLKIYDHVLNSYTVLNNYQAQQIVNYVPLLLWFSPTFRS